MNAETSQLTEESSSTSSGSTVCLLLVGKTGHGKSATGNSILGSKFFKASPGSESVTVYAHSGSMNVDGYAIKVVDTPGVCDTRMGTEESAKVAMRRFHNGIALCPEGFHALVLVFKFGQRMTGEEKESIKKLKEMLGENILREWTILLVTYGDNFDEEEVRMPFKEWFKKQPGFTKDLLQECNNRFVLFNNKTKDKTELSRQRKELLDCVNGLQTNGQRYTNQLFENAREIWQKLTRKRKYANVIERVNTCLNEVSNDLQAALNNAAETGEAYFDRLNGKLSDLRDLIKDVEETEKGKMEADIKVMGERIKNCQLQTQKTRGQAYSQEIEKLKKQYETEMIASQEKFMEMQKHMQEEMIKLCESMNQDRNKSLSFTFRFPDCSIS